MHRALQDHDLPWKAFEDVELVVAFPSEVAVCRQGAPRRTGYIPLAPVA